MTDLTKQQELKLRIAQTVKDLHEKGTKDAEAMWVLGSFAASIIDSAKVKSWAELRRVMSQADQDLLLTSFRDKGNEFLKDNNHPAAYGVQALSLSVAARAEKDPQTVEGAQILDTIIDRAALFFRDNPPKTN